MDPNATLDAIRDAVRDADLITARDRWNDLETWVDSGGFRPSGMPEVLEALNQLERDLASWNR